MKNSLGPYSLVSQLTSPVYSTGSKEVVEVILRPFAAGEDPWNTGTHSLQDLGLRYDAYDWTLQEWWYGFAAKNPHDPRTPDWDLYIKGGPEPGIVEIENERRRAMFVQAPPRVRLGRNYHPRCDFQMSERVKYIASHAWSHPVMDRLTYAMVYGLVVQTYAITQALKLDTHHELRKRPLSNLYEPLRHQLIIEEFNYELPWNQCQRAYYKAYVSSGCVV